MLYVRLIYGILYSIRMSKTAQNQTNQNKKRAMMSCVQSDFQMKTGCMSEPSFSLPTVDTQISHKNNSGRRLNQGFAVR